MALKYQPKQGAVVMCDFSGYVIPEMVKIRPVVVLAKHPDNNQLVTVVPLSTTEPLPHRAYHHKIHKNPLPDKASTVCWAKCDMVATVSLSRLDRYKLAQRLPDGSRQYVVPVIDAADFDEIQKCVKSALGLK
jgi:uncharacterized protein YifN (PemK superfamily)